MGIYNFQARALLGDALGNLVKARLKIKRVRSDTFGYLQRSFLGCVSEVDANEAREVGERAVQFAAWHAIDGSVTIERVGDYGVPIQLQPIGGSGQGDQVHDRRVYQRRKRRDR